MNRIIPDYFQIKKEARYNVSDYSFYESNLQSLKNFPFKLYPSVVPAWDNSARKPNDPTLILTNNSPELFDAWVKKVKEDFIPYSADENLIFINAWNEWAEGNHLEPCRDKGFGYLNAIKNNFKN